jgi:deoxyribonuclease-4
MLIIGSHVGFRKDEELLGSVKEALSYGSNTFMFYTGAPQNTIRYKIEDGLTLEAMKLMKENNIDYSKVIVHAPYIINMANSMDMDKYQFAVNFLKQEVERCEELGAKYLVLHPGSHTGQGIEMGIKNIARGLNLVLDGDTSVTILLETMAGKGTEVGSKLEEIAGIIKLVDNKEHIGVCLDTCHLSDAGYDIVNFDKFLDNFDKVVGLKYVHCIHVNDSKNEVGAHKDRHENFGFGHIGFNTLINIIYNKRLEDIPKILETPYVDSTYPPYKYEIAMIRNKIFDKDLLDKIRKQVV